MKAFTIRVSDELNEWLEKQAGREDRRKNNLVVHLLEEARRDWMEELNFPGLDLLVSTEKIDANVDAPYPPLESKK